RRVPSLQAISSSWKTRKSATCRSPSCLPECGGDGERAFGPLPVTPALRRYFSLIQPELDKGLLARRGDVEILDVLPAQGGREDAVNAHEVGIVEHVALDLLEHLLAALGVAAHAGL